MCFAATAKPIVKNMAHELHAVQQNRRTSKFRQYHGCSGSLQYQAARTLWVIHVVDGVPALIVDGSSKTEY